MKSEDFLKRYGHLNREELPAEAQQLLSSEASIEQAYAAFEQQTRLLGLKRYEQPEAALEGRVIFNVRTRLEAGETLDVPELSPGIGFYALRVGGAALALALAVSVYQQMKLPATNLPAVVHSGPDINNQFKAIPTTTNSEWLAVQEADGTIQYLNTNSNLRLPSPPGAVPVTRPVRP